MTETSAWKILLIRTLMETTSMEVEWKYAIVASTVQCVMRVGVTVMLQSSVTMLVTVLHIIVSIYHNMFVKLYDQTFFCTTDRTRGYRTNGVRSIK